eukprot:gnl/TRDRNA2_/TRDRNA2_183582_c0_seq1.p1 gnl/TRDRNA2_/TRDRNA2_183582_c0~~gnl/TRDRNA2_/TRDRNA2_183582_c0_seq1.p1  ORF type:complete len:226 (-),score=41.69 gnl/TRDRNA2_/TRDRNA2_183582_c0_seq1:64-741(-)
MPAIGHHVAAVSFDAQAASDPAAATTANTLSKRVGRTGGGQICNCTDPPDKKQKSAAGAMGSLFSSGPNRNHEEVMAEMKKQRLAAQRENADSAMKGPWNQFESASRAYDAALKQLHLSFEKFRTSKAAYLDVYNMVSKEHLKWCKPLMDDYAGVPLDCKKDRQMIVDQFLARRSTPDCAIGKEASFKDLRATQAAAAEPLCVAAGAGTAAFRRKRGQAAGRTFL